MSLNKCLFFYYIVEFRSGKAPILLATDVASRGLGKIYIQLYTVLTVVMVWY